MVSSPASPVAQGPSTPPPTTTDPATENPQAPQPSGLTGLLTPVPPARATFSLDPTRNAPAATNEGTVAAGNGVSSSSYHAANDPQTQTQSNNSTGAAGKPAQGVLRAWLLAGAERWKKGADARNKALDIKKARAQAFQVKESRSINRSEKIFGGSTSSGTSTQNNAGKSLNNKASQARKDTSGPKNSSRHNGPGGRGNGGQGHAGPSRGGDHGTDHRKTLNNGPTGKDNAGPKHAPKTPSGPDKGKDGKGRSNVGGSSETSGRGTGSGKAGSQGATGKDGKPGKDAPVSGTLKPKANDAKGKPDQGSTSPEKPRKADPKAAPSPAKPGPAAPPGILGKGIPWKTDRPPSIGTPNGATRKPLNVQESREAGYRDGTRAATVAAHVEAWRDGVRDGWTDRKAEAAREKARLDQAHTTRTQPTAPQQKVPPMPTEPPTTRPGTQPIQVTAVTHTGVTLGDGADRSSISHGEVRSLKQFQRKLAAKTETLARIAEGSRSLKAHAEEQLKHITHLTELARLSNAGDDLLSGLLKLEEAAKAQSMAADEIITRAVRGHEACNVLTGNTETRYGGIYQAVIDSGLIAPANLHYYKDSAHAV